MTTILTKVQQFLDSDNIDGAREEVVKNFRSLKRVDSNIRELAALLALGSQKALEIGLGVLGRELLNRDQDININILWLFLAATLSRQNITPDSSSRISILGLTSSVQNWELPIFALLTPALDSFFKISLSQENSLIAEQTLDFFATSGESYAKAPRTKNEIKELKSLTKFVLNKVDDLELQGEWSEGLERFFQTADEMKYTDQNIWSAASDLVKIIYPNKILNSDSDLGESNFVKNNILRLITSSIASISLILDNDNDVLLAVGKSN